MVAKAVSLCCFICIALVKEIEQLSKCLSTICIPFSVNWTFVSTAWFLCLVIGPLWCPFLGAVSILERLAVGDRSCKYFSQFDVCCSSCVYLGIIFVQSNYVLSASI